MRTTLWLLSFGARFPNQFLRTLGVLRRCVSPLPSWVPCRPLDWTCSCPATHHGRHRPSTLECLERRELQLNLSCPCRSCSMSRQRKRSRRSRTGPTSNVTGKIPALTRPNVWTVHLAHTTFAPRWRVRVVHRLHFNGVRPGWGLSCAWSQPLGALPLNMATSSATFNAFGCFNHVFLQYCTGDTRTGTGGGLHPWERRDFFWRVGGRVGCHSNAD